LGYAEDVFRSIMIPRWPGY